MNSIPRDAVRACALALSGAALVACSSVPENPLAGAVRADDRDSAIVEAAALDFLANDHRWEGSGKDGIVVVDETLSAALVFGWLRPGDLAPDVWRDDLESGLASLRARNAEARPIDWHFSEQANIRDVVLKGIESSAIDEAAALGKCVTTFALPGVYAGGERATVVFEIAPEYHGRFFFSSLKHVDGRWRVERRHDFEYL